MTEKSHVSLERKVCFVCFKEYDTETILLDRRGKASMEQHTVTGVGICPEHQEQLDNGYVIMIGVTNCPAPGVETMKPSEAQRSGGLASLDREAWGNVFTGVDVPEDGIAFVEQEVIDRLKKILESSQGTVQ